MAAPAHPDEIWAHQSRALVALAWRLVMLGLVVPNGKGTTSGVTTA
jgi:hypothetical protein